MPIAVRCDDCGKNYSVSSSMVGKKVKCKTCGHAFTIAAPVPRYASGAPLQPAPVQLKTAAAEAERPHPFDRLITIAPRFYPNMKVLLGCLLVATALALAADQLPTVYSGVLFVFPVLAVVMLVVGMISVTAEAARTPGSFKFPWKDSVFIIVSLTVGLLIGLFVFRVRRGYALQVGAFYNRTADLVVRSAGVASMTLLMLFIPFCMKASQPNPPSLLEQRVAAENAADKSAHGPVMHLFIPPPTVVPERQ